MDHGGRVRSRWVEGGPGHCTFKKDVDDPPPQRERGSTTRTACFSLVEDTLAGYLIRANRAEDCPLAPRTSRRTAHRCQGGRSRLCPSRPRTSPTLRPNTPTVTCPCPDEGRGRRRRSRRVDRILTDPQEDGADRTLATQKGTRHRPALPKPWTAQGTGQVHNIHTEGYVPVFFLSFTRSGTPSVARFPGFTQRCAGCGCRDSIKAARRLRGIGVGTTSEARRARRTTPVARGIDVHSSRVMWHLAEFWA